MMKLFSIIFLALFFSASGFAASNNDFTGYTVEKIVFEGASPLDKMDLDKLFKIEEGIFYRLTDEYVTHKQKFADPSFLKDAQKKIERFYRERGYYHAKVNYLINQDRRTKVLRVKFIVAENQPIRIRKINIDFSGEIPPALREDVSELINIAPGEIFRVDDYNAVKTSVVRYLSNLGYFRADVIGNVKIFMDKNEAEVSYMISPGEVCYFDQIFIEGNIEVSDTVIWQEVLFFQGEKFSSEKIQKTQKALYDLQVFRSVEIRTEDIAKDTSRIRVIITVTEKKPRMLRFGIGYSTEELMRYQVQWVHNNLFGGAQQFSINTKYSHIFRGVTADILYRHFFERPTDLNITSSVTRDIQPYYTNDKIKERAMFSRMLLPEIKGFTAYNLEYNEVKDVSPEAKIEAEDAYHSGQILSYFEFGLDRITTDNLFSPTKGTDISLVLESGAKFLGSAITYFKTTGQVKGYHTFLSNLTLAGKIKLGAIKPTGSSAEVPIYKRYKSGGDYSVRGFGYQKLGPVDGGNSLLEAGIETRIRIYKAFEGAVFLDLGNVRERYLDYSAGTIRYAAGYGIRYGTPVGALRLDIGYKLNDILPTESRYQVHFNIGYAF